MKIYRVEDMYFIGSDKEIKHFRTIITTLNGEKSLLVLESPLRLKLCGLGRITVFVSATICC